MKYELIAFNGRTIVYRDVFSDKGIAFENAYKLSVRFDRVIVNRLSKIGITELEVGKKEV